MVRDRLRDDDVTVSYNRPTESASNTDPIHYDSDIIEIEGVRITLAIIQSLCIVLAAIGNGFVIYFILKYRKLRRDATAFLILNLAICDFIGAVLQQPMRLVDILLPFENPEVKMNNWGATYCKITGFNSTLISSSGFLTVVAIAVERYLLICHPMKAKSLLTHRNIQLTIILIWIVSFITTLPLPIKFTYVAHAHFKEVNVTICMQDIFSENSVAGKEYYMFIFLFYFVIPVIIICTCYTKVFYVLYSKISTVEIENPVSRRVMLARKRLAKMMLFIAVIFTVLHGPFFITFFMVACGLGIYSNGIFWLILLETLPVVNAAINPFVYSAHSRTFFKRKMVGFLGGQFEDSTIYRKNSASASVRSAQPSTRRDVIPSLTTETTSLRTDSIRTASDLSRNVSFRTHDSSSLQSADSFRLHGEADSLRREEYMNNVKDSSFSQEEKLPLSQIEEEMESMTEKIRNL